jgi:Zn-finger nucleic acid-binding protein
MAHPYRDAGGGPRIQCPRCRTELAEVLVGERTIHTCPSCHGLWIEPELFVAALIETELQTAVRMIDRGHKPVPQSSERLPCPVCRRVMARTEFGRTSGILVDGCRRHGIWLDPTESSRIIDYALEHQPREPVAAEIRIPRLSKEEWRKFELYPSPKPMGWLVYQLIEFFRRPRE